ncbi:MAG: RidA family protein, partial [Thermoguttaceae bacterium]
AREEILNVRRTAFLDQGLDPALPITFVDGRSVFGSDFTGIQVWGIVPHDFEKMTVSTVSSSRGGPGRLWKGEDCRMLYLPFLEGSGPSGKLPGCATSQAECMFANANTELKANGFAYDQVVRTWIYLARILDWYGEFNRVRTMHHTSVGIGRDLRISVFPASTGIQGKCFKDEECFMDLLAIDSQKPGAVDIELIRHTSRQHQAFSYGSAFSRGVSLEMEGRKTVFVSGTASINTAGQTVHWDDAEAQCIETLLNIAALLEDHGGGLENICSAVVFCKNQEVFDAYQRVACLLGIPHFPTVYVLADVCRSELLVEIEPVAII